MKKKGASVPQFWCCILRTIRLNLYILFVMIKQDQIGPVPDAAFH